MKVHKAKAFRRWGGVGTTSLCGRLNAGSRDGMNVTDADNEVTCAFCLKRMASPNAGGAANG